MDKAKWISTKMEILVDGVNPWEAVITEEVRAKEVQRGKGLALFRKEFEVDKGLSKARIKVSALGNLDLFVNGKRVGDDLLKPGWTDFSKRVFYLEYDISDFLVEGSNCILANLSRGWWQGRISLGTYGAEDIAFMASLKIDYKDGKTKELVTDETWKTSIGGPILNADIWDGEIYDARVDNQSFKQAAFDDSAWDTPFIVEYEGEITKHIGPTIKERKFLNMVPKSLKLYEGIEDNGTDFGKALLKGQYENGQEILIKKGQTLVIDLGQNLVGWPKFTAKGDEGTSLIMRFAEMLNDSGKKERANDGPEGSLYTANYRSAKSILSYTFAGHDFAETYSPSHTFYGFRYMEVRADGDITLLNIKAIVVGTDIKEKGKIETSNSDVNQLISNVIWGQRGNYLSVPTDCPQRDERLGWSGDTQIFVGGASYNGDVREFFHKWTQDMRDSQGQSGAFPDVAPRVRVVGEGNAAWADAGVVVPYVIYKMYADKDIIKDNFEAMDKYIEYLKTFGLGGGNAVYGDWLNYEDTDKKYIACTHFAMVTMYMAEMAGAIGSEKEEDYKKLYQDIKGYFQKTYLDEEGNLIEKSQTAYLLALKIKLLPEDYIERVANFLEKKIIDNGYRLSTGFIGTGTINQTLSEYGKSNIAYSLLLQDQDPSWLYSVHQGATTIWERWNSYTLERGFGDVNMNSFNHYAYGAVIEWMYKYMAGIDTCKDNPGFKKVILRPMPDTRKANELPKGQENITFVKASYESASGLIKSSWSMDEGIFKYSASVPVKASLYFPLVNKKSSISINGQERKIEEFEKVANTIKIELEAGDYEIV